MTRRLLLSPPRSVHDIKHEFVDMGLSVLWATCDVGASKPEEQGWLFAYGDVEPYDINNISVNSGEKITPSWSTYKWSNGSNKELTKYCTNSNYGYNGFVDNKILLDPEDDAAHVFMGEGWRMASREDFTELSKNSVITLVDNMVIVKSLINNNELLFPKRIYGINRILSDSPDINLYFMAYSNMWTEDTTARYLRHSLRGVRNKD